jgi:hypothetical protein
LREHGVSDGANSVHPIGRPIENSNCSGVISRPPKASTKRRQLGHFCIDGATKFAFRVGVCNKPPTISLMVCPDISPRYTAVVRWVAKSIETSSRVGDCLFLDVLGNDAFGSDAIDEALHLGPEIGRGASSSRSCAEWLAREPAADGGGVEVGKLANVGMARDIGPVLGEHASAERVDLDKSDRPHSGSLQSEGKSANSAKEVEDIHRGLASLLKMGFRHTHCGHGCADKCRTLGSGRSLDLATAGRRFRAKRRTATCNSATTKPGSYRRQGEG